MGVEAGAGDPGGDPKARARRGGGAVRGQGVGPVGHEGGGDADESYYIILYYIML